MKALLISLVVVAFAAPAVFADYTCSYDWEDCGTVLGLYGGGTPPIIVTNVGAPDPVYSGFRSLKLEDNSPSGTPQAYVAWVTDLADGDSIFAQFARYDTSPDASPSCRIWGHWNDTDSLQGYSGSASGNGDYGLGLGWDVASFGWSVADGHTGLVIECRTYSNPGDIVWIDDMVVSYYGTGSPCIHFPVAGASATEASTWGGIKALFR